MILRDFLLFYCFLFVECNTNVIVYYAVIHFAIVSAPRTVRSVARWKNDIKRGWKDEEPEHFG